MKKVLMFCFVAAFLIVSSCTKDKMSDKLENKSNSESIKTNSTSQISRTDFLKNYETVAKQNSKKFVENFINKVKTNNPYARPGQCGSMDNVNHEFIGAIFSDGYCANTGTATVRYYTTIIEHAGINNLDYSFNLILGLGAANFVGTATPDGSNNNVMVCVPYVPANGDDYCYYVKKYYVDYIIPTSYFGEGGGEIIVTGSCVVSPTPEVKSEFSEFDISDNWYLNTPARVQINQSGNGFYVVTECTIICHPDYVECPLSGTLTYQLQSPFSPNPNPILVVNILPTGTGYISAGTGTYNFSSVLTYSFGNSQTLNGTFTIF